MNEEDWPVVGVLHVDEDDPHVVTLPDGKGHWFLPDEPEPDAERQVLPPAWKSIGFTTEADISLDAIRAFIGVDPSPRRGPSDVAMAVTTIGCPVVAPVKRRGLTGKRYRIARRRYARQMRDYRRGLILPVRVSYVLPRVRPLDVVETVRGMTARFTIVDEASGSEWYEGISPSDAKPGYGE